MNTPKEKQRAILGELMLTIREHRETPWWHFRERKRLRRELTDLGQLYRSTFGPDPEQFLTERGLWNYADQIVMDREKLKKLLEEYSQEYNKKITGLWGIQDS